MNALETYIREVRDIRSSGEAVAETSYYPALANLLNEVGKHLKPKVHCVLTLKNRGAGLPDGGLFTEDQLQKKAGTPTPNQVPARGVVEVKGTAEDAWVIAEGEQVTRYWGKYRQVLVTNLRDFVLVGQDTEGNPVKLEGFRLAPDEESFWNAALHPRTIAELCGPRFEEYLKRVLLHAAPLANPQDVAWFLASYAREARLRIEGVNLPALDAVRTALEQALGVKFQGEKGEHFFRSTLVQTLFYGVFSAWVLWCKKHPPSDTKARFNWHEAAWDLRVPMIKALYDQVATPAKLGPLRLVEVLNWTGAALNRVDRASFFQQFVEGQAVQYFYEPFLEAFDPELRKELGVWYTPIEVVRYMVSRVDTVLRQELDRPDGLASPDVYVLDPCCGTGAYLVEVLRRIHDTLKEKGGGALVGEDLKRAAMERIFGFEVLPAPFVVSHLQLGLLLKGLGAPLSERRDERVGVYLTNALTGWEPPKEPQSKLIFPELEEERDAAERVKRDAPILVVLGNPPYNAYAGVSPAEEEGLVEPYKEGLITEWGIKKFNLDELYVRFFRLAERRIAETTGKGIVSFISNYSWLADPSFVVLRKHLLDSFDKFWVENMHGNRTISEYAPDGHTSETVFAVSGSSPGIRQGVAISLWVKHGGKRSKAIVRFRDDVNDAKAANRRAHLLNTLNASNLDASYEVATPHRDNRYSFRPMTVSAIYAGWPSVAELSLWEPLPGVLEKRKGALTSMDRAVLEKRMKKYFDTKVQWDEARGIIGGLALDAARFNARAAREKAISLGPFDPAALRRLVVMPMDVRWCYYTTVRPLWNEPRPRYGRQCWSGNPAIVCRRKADANPEGMPFNFFAGLGADQLIHKHAYFIPLSVRADDPQCKKPHTSQPELLPPERSAEGGPEPNMSEHARQYIEAVGVSADLGPLERAKPLWMHVLAIGYSPNYLTENKDGIRGDWPRVPLPDSKRLLCASAQLGEQVAALLDTGTEVKGVTVGTPRAEMKLIGLLSTDSGGQASADAGDLDITAGWGHEGKGGVTMPAKGRLLLRAYTNDERVAIENGARALGLSAKDALDRLGGSTFDIYLNEVAYWCNVPLKAWEYTIGGYQVIKKWLSYREKKLLGRAVTPDEVRHVTSMSRRIAALLLLGPALDANYRQIKTASFDWSALAEK